MKKYSNNLYNKNLRSFANLLRKNLTKSEACLWKYALRNRQMKGYAFRRQRPVMNYIADFCSLQLKLVIELDGITHHDEPVQRKDFKKDADLTKNGFTVLRFSDNAVLNEMENVKSTIENWIDEYEKTFLPIHPRREAPPPLAGDTS